RPANSVENTSRYDPMVLAMPQALVAARAVMMGGNYFDLYSASVPFFRQSNGFSGSGFGSDGGVGGDGGPSGLTARPRAVQQLETAIQAFQTSQAQGCLQFGSALNSAVNGLLGLGFNEAFEIGTAWIGISTPQFPGIVDCRAQTVTTAQTMAQATHVKDVID